MANEKTWQYSNNVVMDQTDIGSMCKHVAWYLKALLLGQLSMTNQVGDAVPSPSGVWTLEASSDGVTAAASDLWGSTLDLTKLVRANAGTNHSWVQLRAPVALGGWRLVIDLSSANAYGIVFSIFKNAPTTAGTVTNRPAQASDPAQTYDQQVVENALSPHMLHGKLDTEGRYMLLSSKNGSGRFWFMHMFQYLAEAKAGDPLNGFFYAEYIASARGVLQLGALGANGTAFRGFTAVGAHLTQTCVPFLSHTGAAIFSSMSGVDETDNKYNDMPCYLYTNAPAKSIRGRLIDVRHTHTALAIGDVEPLTGQILRTVCGDCLIPANAAPSL